MTTFYYLFNEIGQIENQYRSIAKVVKANGLPKRELKNSLSSGQSGQTAEHCEIKLIVRHVIVLVGCLLDASTVLNEFCV